MLRACPAEFVFFFKSFNCRRERINLGEKRYSFYVNSQLCPDVIIGDDDDDGRKVHVVVRHTGPGVRVRKPRGGREDEIDAANRSEGTLRVSLSPHPKSTPWSCPSFPIDPYRHAVLLPFSLVPMLK